jgi:uncharacterized protein (DUF983 family)
MTTEARRPKDLPRMELAKLAQEAMTRYPGAKIYFKFTCAHCGERCMFGEPGMLYETGECHKCGKETTVTEGGFALSMEL